MRVRTITCLGLTGLMLLAVGCATTPQREGMPNQQPATLNTTVDVSCGYWLYLPEKYNADKKNWPLVLFLHGAGERGDNLDLVKKWGPPKRAAGGEKYPFILVSPQCPSEEWWTSAKQITTLDALLNDIVKRYRVDEDRVYATGLSMGGYGTWELAMQFPNRFAAIVPICGGGDPHHAEHIKHGKLGDVGHVDDAPQLIHCGDYLLAEWAEPAVHRLWLTWRPFRIADLVVAHL